MVNFQDQRHDGQRAVAAGWGMWVSRITKIYTSYLKFSQKSYPPDINFGEKKLRTHLGKVRVQSWNIEPRHGISGLKSWTTGSQQCLLETRQIIQVHNGQQARPVDSPAKSVSEEGQPEGVPDDVQAEQDVWDGTRVQEGRMAGPVFWGLRGASHVSNAGLWQMGHHR